MLQYWGLNACIPAALSEERNWLFCDFLMPSSFLKFAQMKLSDFQSTPETDNGWNALQSCLPEHPCLSRRVGPGDLQRFLPASAILWSCDSPSIYKSSVTEQQLRIGLTMKSLLCLTVKVGISCKSSLSSNLLWVVLISEGSALRIWCCFICSILSFIMQIKYYTPVLIYCQCSAWYFKTQPFGCIAIIQKVGIFFSCSFSKDFRCWNQST